jgi:hypothetical protein
VILLIDPFFAFDTNRKGRVIWPVGYLQVRKSVASRHDLLAHPGNAQKRATPVATSTDRTTLFMTIGHSPD